MPVPNVLICCGLVGAFVATFTVPPFDPRTVGKNVTLIVQLALGASAAPQLLVTWNSPAVVMPTICRGATPILVRVALLGALLVFRSWLPKFRTSVSRETTGPVTGQLQGCSTPRDRGA